MEFCFLSLSFSPFLIQSCTQGVCSSGNRGRVGTTQSPLGGTMRLCLHSDEIRAILKTVFPCETVVGMERVTRSRKIRGQQEKWGFALSDASL